MEKENKQSLCKNVLKEMLFIKTEYGITAYLNYADGVIEMPYHHKETKNYIKNEVEEKYSVDVSSNTVNEAMNSFEALLNKTLVTQTLSNHNKNVDGEILINKRNAERTYYSITSKGWKEKAGAEKEFHKNPMQGKLVEAKKGGNIDLIFKYCRIPNELHLLFKVYLVTCFLDIIHPCIILQGVAGSSKSTVCQMLKLLIDPCGESRAFRFPKSEDELRQVFTDNYFGCFDNMREIKYGKSDYLCSAITGTEIIKRKLFTDSDTCRYTLRNPIVLNGISNVVTEPDLIDRSIIIELPVIHCSERKSEKKLFKEYHKDLPEILGGIFDCLSKMLKVYKEDSIPNLPRMADFAEYGYYIADTFGLGKGNDFLETYNALIERQKKEIINDDFFSSTVIKFIRRKEYNGLWVGSMKELHEELSSIAESMDFNYLKHGFPKTPQLLSRLLKTLIPVYSSSDMYLYITRNNDNLAEVHLADLPLFNMSYKSVLRKPIICVN